MTYYDSATGGCMLETVAAALRANVKVADRRHLLRTHRQCFVACEAVTFLVQSGAAPTRQAAVQLCRVLAVEYKVFEPATGAGNNKSGRFKDDKAFYRFLDGGNYSNRMMTRGNGDSDGGMQKWVQFSARESDEISAVTGVETSTERTEATMPGGSSRGSSYDNSSSSKGEIDAQSKASSSSSSGGTASKTSGRGRIDEIAEILFRNLNDPNKRGCFVGSEAVDFLVQSGLAKTRVGAVALGRMIQTECNLFQHVMGDTETFQDNEQALYRFTTSGAASRLSESYQGGEEQQQPSVVSGSYSIQESSSGILRRPSFDDGTCSFHGDAATASPVAHRVVQHHRLNHVPSPPDVDLQQHQHHSNHPASPLMPSPTGVAAFPIPSMTQTQESDEILKLRQQLEATLRANKTYEQELAARLKSQLSSALGAKKAYEEQLSTLDNLQQRQQSQPQQAQLENILERNGSKDEEEEYEEVTVLEDEYEEITVLDEEDEVTHFAPPRTHIAQDSEEDDEEEEYGPKPLNRLEGDNKEEDHRPRPLHPLQQKIEPVPGQEESIVPVAEQAPAPAASRTEEEIVDAPARTANQRSHGSNSIGKVSGHSRISRASKRGGDLKDRKGQVQEETRDESRTRPRCSSRGRNSHRLSSSSSSHRGGEGRSSSHREEDPAAKQPRRARSRGRRRSSRQIDTSKLDASFCSAHSDDSLPEPQQLGGGTPRASSRCRSRGRRGRSSSDHQVAGGEGKGNSDRSTSRARAGKRSHSRGRRSSWKPVAGDDKKPTTKAAASN